jgi:hypothetical protein
VVDRNLASMVSLATAGAIVGGPIGAVFSIVTGQATGMAQNEGLFIGISTIITATGGAVAMAMRARNKQIEEHLRKHNSALGVEIDRLRQHASEMLDAYRLQVSVLRDEWERHTAELRAENRELRRQIEALIEKISHQNGESDDASSELVG